ncbi:MAG: hypothetical protein HXY41_00655 [Chloroflexi bacterium]|nr:hypothetical protein [Chloroflexota bacterium]
MDELTSAEQVVQQATQLTATNLRKLVAEASLHENTSHVSVPEQEELIELISRILPAGNVVGFVFNGLLNVKERKLPPAEGRAYFNSLFKGLAIVRNNAFYRMMFAGPATVLAGFSFLLQLAGVRSEDYLPEGAWQFYVEFGLREDAARHNTETTGFQQAIRPMRPAPSESEQLTAWVMAAMWLLRDYHYLLASVWEENVRLTVMEQTTGLPRLHRAWEKIRPFKVPDGLSQQFSIPAYRRQRFDSFCDEQLAQVGARQRYSFEAAWKDPARQKQRELSLQAYVRQLSILSYLEPGEYGEQRIPIRNTDLHVGVIYKDAYYLLKFVDPTTPTAPALIHAQVDALLRAKSSNPAQADLILLAAPRTAQQDLRRLLGQDQRQSLEMLQKTPILINWDQASSSQPLQTIRRGRRGIGDHALTIFHTDGGMVFDFSHIYFDGPWAMATAEMLTNQAVYYVERRVQSQGAPPRLELPIALDLTASPKLERAARKLSPVITHISAEASVDIAPITDLRRLLIRRTRPPIHLTVNDLLVLHRVIFNQRYKPSLRLQRALDDLRKKPDGKPLARLVDDMLAELGQSNPSLLIPIDATHANPKDRLFPSTFRNPFVDFYPMHDDLLRLLNLVAHKTARKDEAFHLFHKARTDYVSLLDAFSRVMRRYRQIAMDGQSMSTTAIRLIAGLPGSMQKMMDDIPGRFSFMNEAIKGEEVFSNVGQVTPGSSISRFSSAKDDNDKKVLVWGIMTDNHNRLCITLRDFRPPVTALAQAGYETTAQAITQDFLDRFMESLLAFVEEVHGILTGPKA